MDENFRNISIAIIFVALAVLAFFLVKPILLSVIFGVILAFAFSPTYDWLYKKTKSPNLSAAIVLIILIIVLVLPLWFLTPIFIDQSIKLYLSSQQIDFFTPLKNIFPSLLEYGEFSSQIASIIYSFVTNITTSLMNSFSNLILNSPIIILQSVIVFFSFFFSLRDKKELLFYVKSLLPFTKEVEEKLFKASKEITSAVIYGQIIIGMLQGLIVGAGFFIFRVPNALLLTLFAIFAGIFPIVGPAFIWVPVIIYLFISGNTVPLIGVTIFGVISSLSDNFLRPIFVSKKTMLHPGIVIVGMVGGFLMFGVLGFILGPLILAYLITIIEIYRHKKISGILIQEKQ